MLLVFAQGCCTIFSNLVSFYRGSAGRVQDNCPTSVYFAAISRTSSDINDLLGEISRDSRACAYVPGEEVPQPYLGRRRLRVPRARPPPARTHRGTHSGHERHGSFGSVQIRSKTESKSSKIKRTIELYSRVLKSIGWPAANRRAWRSTTATSRGNTTTSSAASRWQQQNGTLLKEANELLVFILKMNNFCKFRNFWKVCLPFRMR